VERKIYVIGGRTDTKDISNQVFSAYILSDGTLTGSQDNPAWWQEERGLSRDPKLKLYRHSAVHGGNGSIYVIGGQDANDKSLNSVLYTLPLDLDKSRDPADPLHEGDTITYTISYTNTSLITQTIAITDILPYNLTLISETVTLPPTRRQGFALVWDLGGVGPGDSGEISFQMQVPLLPGGRLVSAAGPPPPEQPAPSHVLPVPIACDTTRFWAAGVTRQLVEDSPYTLQVNIPPGSSPTTMWLAVKEARDINLVVGDQRAERIATSTREIGASLWSAPVTTQAIQSGQVSVISNSPRRLNAIFLFEGDKPVFETSAFYDVNKGTYTTTYTLDIPSVQTQTMDVILPFMDITYWQDILPPQLDTRMTTVTVQLEGRPPQRAVANDPNIGNGLLMTQFPLDIGPLSHVVTATKQLTITVDTQDSIYTLGPRICRPVYVENTAWLCSKEAGCISAWVDNPPEHFAPPSVYLPIIFKSSSP
jgi:uncharacterized repeat protein (TIGR01451 family)